MKRIIGFFLGVIVVYAVGLGCGSSGSGGSSLPDLPNATLTSSATNAVVCESVVITFASAVSESARTALGTALTVVDPDSVAVEYTLSWNDDYTVLTVTPTNRLLPYKQYTATISADSFGDLSEDWSVSITMGKADSYVGANCAKAFVVGAPGDLTGATLYGNGYVFVNTSTAATDAKSIATLLGDTNLSIAHFSSSDTYIGWDVSISGDVNGDGYSDIATTALHTTDGRTYIFFGNETFGATGSSALTVSDAFVFSGQAGETCGSSSNIIGDLNGDGYDEIGVGCTYPFDGSGNSAYVLFGKSGFSKDTAVGDVSYVRITGPGSVEFGRIVRGVGDVLGADGIPDILISAPTDDGLAYVISGSAIADLLNSGSQVDATIGSLSSSLVSISGATDMTLGTGSGALGDVSNDENNVPDFLVISRGGTGAYDDKALGFVFFGENLTAGTVITYESADAIFNFATGFSETTSNVNSIPGDVNADGISDFLVARGCNDDSGVACASFTQRVFLFLGGSDFTSVIDSTTKEVDVTDTTVAPQATFVLTPSASDIGYYFGFSTELRDFDFDGDIDVIITSPYAGTAAGLVYVFYNTGSGFEGDYTMSLGDSNGPDLAISGDTTLSYLGFF